MNRRTPNRHATSRVHRNLPIAFCASLAVSLLSGFPLSGARAQGPATDAGIQSQMQAAQRGVAMDALRRHQGESSGGCASLPAGWASADVTVNFPAEYRGYPAWVNSAELLPVGADLQAFVARRGGGGSALVRPAVRSGAMSVQSTVCAPAGHEYWVVVDSGRQRAAVGRIRLQAGHGGQHYAVTAPPLAR